jgi:hypothetical protein
MELPVHTGLMRLERQLYPIGAIQLPRPVTLLEAGVFACAFALLLAVSRALGLGLNPSWAWTYLALPWLATRACTGLVADRKRLHQWMLSQLRYLLLEPRLLARLRPVREPAEARLRVRVWQPARRWDEMASLRRSRRLRRGHVRGRWNGGAR